MTETLGGGFHIEYATGGGLFLSYRDKTSASSCVQDELYADDLTLIAETRKELQHMMTTLDQACERWGMHINGRRQRSSQWCDRQSTTTETQRLAARRSGILPLPWQ